MALRQLEWSVEAGQVVLDGLSDHERLVLPALQALQHAFGFIPAEAVRLVSSFINVSVAETHGVLSFYRDLRVTAPAAVTVALCTAEGCQANGARTLVEQVAEAIAPIDGRSADGNVDVVEVFCLGNCALGPAALVNERLLGRVDVTALSRAVDAAGQEAIA